MRLLICRAALLLVFACILHSGLRAQVPSGGHGRVGVALGGGSALGLAHIGVIRYFEEHRIPIDDIAGTSMGGLIGGFYAVGMDSGQITKLVEQADWDVLLDPVPRFVDQPVVDKQRWDKAAGNLTLRLGKHFSLPAGLNSGQALSMLLSRTTLAYSEVSNFDDLPTPFRCVATDLVSGKAAVLQQGSLPHAMRATMSLPGIFTPVKLHGMVLVDGGLVENIPVDVVREMGARTVIAVSLEVPKTKPSELKTISDVLRQSVSVVIADNERRSLRHADLHIAVDTTKFSVADYSKWKEIIQAGYAAAQESAADLAKFELSPEGWEQYQRARKQRMRPPVGQGAVVAVVAPTTSFQHRAKAEIDRRLGNRVVSEAELEDVLNGMVEATAVPGASYHWQRAPDKPEGYKVTFFPRPGDQVLVRPSFQYSLSPGEPTRAALKLSTATVFEKAYKSRLLTAINAGYDPGIRTEFYYPFGGSPYFIAPGAFVERFNVNSYQGPVRSSDTRDRFGGSFYGGLGTWRFAQLRVGVQAGYDSYGSTRVVDGVRAASGGFAAPEFRWIYNSQDSGGLPTHGTRVEGSIGYSFRNVSYPYLQNEFSTYQPVARYVTLLGFGRTGTSFGTKLDYYEQFATGGVGQLSAYRYQAFHANTMQTGGAGVILHGPIRLLSTYPGLAMWYEAGRFDMGSLGWQTHQSASAGVFFATPLGAAGLALSLDEAGKARFRLMLGSF